MTAVAFDLRLACRALRRDRVFSLTAIATLAISLTLNATVFTVMDAIRCGTNRTHKNAAATLSVAFMLSFNRSSVTFCGPST